MPSKDPRAIGAEKFQAAVRKIRDKLDVDRPTAIKHYKDAKSRGVSINKYLTELGLATGRIIENPAKKLKKEMDDRPEIFQKTTALKAGIGPKKVVPVVRALLAMTQTKEEAIEWIEALSIESQ